jgi:hypothetical protein
MGRFLSPDSVGGDPTNPQSWNLYSYVWNNPLKNTDPDGHDVNVCTSDSNGNQQCTEMSNEQYQAAQQGNGSLNVPTLDQVGNNQTNGTFNATAITDANGNTVGTATYVPTNPGIDPFVGNNMAGYQTLVAPNNGTNLGKILKCASKTANQFSIAGIMGITESNSVGATIGTAFIGNTFSGIVDTGTHIVTGHFGAAYGDVALGGYAQGLALGPNAPVAAQGVVGVVTNAGVDAALGEGMAGPVGWAKLGIDAATFLGSALYCASN